MQRIQYYSALGFLALHQKEERLLQSQEGGATALGIAIDSIFFSWPTNNMFANAKVYGKINSTVYTWRIELAEWV